MSARLLGLAFSARMPSLAAKVVLLKLVDCCDDDGRNIYPSVATLAAAAECAERTVQRVLKLFCAVGLLRVVREGGAGKGNTRCYEMDIHLLLKLNKAGVFAELEARNAVADNDADAPENPASHAQDAYDGAGEADDMSADRVTPCHPKEALRVTLATAKGDTMSPNPLEEPLNLERESASAGCEKNTLPEAGASVAAGAELPRGEGGADGAPAVTLDDFRKVWPKIAADDQTRLANAWAELPFDARRAAVEGVGPFLAELKAAGRTHAPASWKYLTERRWTLVEAQSAERKATSTVRTIAPWTRDWWALLLRRIAAGENCGLMAQQAANGKGVTVLERDAPSVEASAALRPFECDGPEIAAWRGWFRAKRVELPAFKGSFRVFLPEAEPPGAAARQASGF